MTCIKNVLSLLALAVLLPVGVSSVYADEVERYEVAKVSEAIREITPYLILGEDKLVHFIKDKNDIPLDPKLIEIATDMIEMQNSFISQAIANPNVKPTIDDELREKFSDVVREIQDKKNRPVVSETSGWDWMLPEAFASHSILNVCGGSEDHPHPEPRIEQKIYSEIGSLNTHLLDQGYHLADFYASTLEWGQDRDYTKIVIVDKYGCGSGPFRDQALITSWNTYNHQSPEPNPEVLRYGWPVWWWPSYVSWWHANF